MTNNRIFNFAAGPATMPVPVLEEAQRHLLALPGVGMSVMEISHRSKTFEDILGQAISDIRELAGVPSNYKILMLQGGASLQFSMVPIDVPRHALIYAGAQKNLGPSGVTLVIIREDLLARSQDMLPTMLNYRVQS